MLIRLLMKYIKPSVPAIDLQFQTLSAVARESAGFLLFHGQKFVFAENRVQTLAYDQLPDSITDRDLLYVGVLDGKPYYAVAIEDIEDHLQTVGLRDLLDEEKGFFQLVGRASQLVNWDLNHRYCGWCGTGTKRKEHALVRVCPQCKVGTYPRISPCVIMLVHRGDSILLSQRTGHSSSYYTVQAGFIEAGESAEQAVVREVMEETGLSLANLRYFDSQPWPFPDQLMLGYFAENLDGQLCPDPSELTNAGWFDYRDLPEYPGPNTLSGKLIRHFIAERDSR